MVQPPNILLETAVSK